MFIIFFYHHDLVSPLYSTNEIFYSWIPVRVDNSLSELSDGGIVFSLGIVYLVVFSELFVFPDSQRFPVRIPAGFKWKLPHICNHKYPLRFYL